MSGILVDTSVWIEFLSKKPRLSAAALDQLSQHIMQDEVLIVEPIRAELLSGGIRKEKKSEFTLLLQSVRSIDPDWNLKATWEQIIELADTAASNRIPVPGVVDRMILQSARASSAQLCTLDQSLLKLAEKCEVQIFTF